MAKIQNVKLKVVGVTFANEDGSQRQEVIRTLAAHQDSEITLVREPTNTFDKNAVKVMTPYGQAGYIGRDYAAILSEMMDRGVQFDAEVGTVDEHKNTHYMHVLINEV